MTRLISAFILVLALLGAWGLYRYWESFQGQRESERKQAAARVVSAEQLPGMPAELQPSLDAAMKQGPKALRYWLLTHGPALHDPRLAWIELDYCTMLARDNPVEARTIFAKVKQRTPPSSPVWPRIQELKGGFE